MKTLPSSYANLSHWLLKTPISKGKWYGRFYNAFCKNCFNKLQSITLRRVLANPQQCATEKIFRIYLKYINSKNTECFLHNSALCILNSALKKDVVLQHLFCNYISYFNIWSFFHKIKFQNLVMFILYVLNKSNYGIWVHIIEIFLRI